METLELIAKHQLCVIALPRNRGFAVGIFGELHDINYPGFFESFEGDLYSCEGYFHQTVIGKTLVNAVAEWVSKFGN